MFNDCGGNGANVHPYLHPQQENVLDFSIYIKQLPTAIVTKVTLVHISGPTYKKLPLINQQGGGEFTSGQEHPPPLLHRHRKQSC